MKTYKIDIKGIVQGVGFRPFIYNLANEFSLCGYVTNTSAGVTIVINSGDVESFCNAVNKRCPVMADIISLDVSEIAYESYVSFEIKSSEVTDGITLVPVDTALCDDCLEDINRNVNRRYNYPFTNCTNCGPRYSIIKSMPYDRPKTTMSFFKMCSECESEYQNPSDRRFHAQPNACPECGPQVYMGELSGDEAIAEALRLLNKGEIIAVKGLGGYHLMCDAVNDLPVKVLRGLKNRPDKPLAIMTDKEKLKSLGASCEELELFDSPQAPITIMNIPNAPISRFANPMSDNIGFLSAYTPLHRILLKGVKSGFLVATSGNRKDEPIAKDEVTAQESLKDFTKHFLHHNRPIHNRVDDSLATVVKGETYVLRRARGYAPFPVMLPVASDKCVLSVGAHLKNSVTITKGNYAFVSQYIGDLDNPDTCSFFEETVMKMAYLYGLKPEAVVCDDHPDYYSSRYAAKTKLPVATVQHHLAHMFSCMAENGLTDNVIGVILDGTGLGTDRTIWGGEFFLMKDGIITREHHFPKVKQPGMDAAAKNPSRMLVSYLHEFNLLDKYKDLVIERLGITEKEIAFIRNMVERNINCIDTTSAGRLFESLGALVTGISKNAFEAHSAMKLEGLITDKNFPEIEINMGDGFFPELFERTLSMLKNNEKILEVSKYIHCAVAKKIVKTVSEISERTGVKDVVLSGGVFQNLTLLNLVLDFKEENMLYNTYVHRKVPPNDSCISLGQAYFAANRHNVKEIVF